MSTALTADDLVPDRALVQGDKDAFDHKAIAARLADLVLEADAPLSVALFGPWGSGKSSIFELLRRALDDQRGSTVALVRYDAWKYGGASLQRNFISHAATQLGFDEGDDANRRFHRGLYEKQRRAELDFDDLSFKKLTPLWLFLGVMVGFLLLVALLAGACSLLTDEDFFGQIGKSLPQLLAPAAIVGAIVAITNGLMGGLTMDVEQSQPAADEEFTKTFRLLKDRAVAKGRERLIFFIDELDRCPPEDVVKTLTAVRTFLDQEDCVFVVAADREVLEEALVALPQATPVDEENPYYSSASSFLDKVFQHQLLLPPLRGRRLTRFARDLVRERGGVWEELREVEPNGRLLDRVIYALVPSHVRSPRRIKVLLNNFATNVRIAESRGLAWKERAREIAKHTVLQTEFPLIGADLQHEPRLPEYLLDPPDSPSPRLQKLLKRHGDALPPAPVPEETGDVDVDDAPPATDPSLVAAQAPRTALATTQRLQLRRYLERARAAEISDPSRDLLFLEPAGAAVGLEDAALGEIVEADAPEVPERVLQALGNRTAQERRQVALVLADMADQEFGDERANVMTALFGAIDLLGPDVAPAAERLADAVSSFTQEQDLKDEHLVGALQLTLRAPVGSRAALIDDLFDRPALMGTVDRTRMVAKLLDELPPERHEAVHVRVSEELAEDQLVLLDPLEVLGIDAALALLAARSVEQATQGVIAADLSEEQSFAHALYETALARDDPRVVEEVQRQLLRLSGAYPVVVDHAEAVFRRDLPVAGLNKQALDALWYGPRKDWEFWAGFLRDPEAEDPSLATGAWEAIQKVLEHVASAPQDEDVAVTTLGQVRPFLAGAEPADVEELHAVVVRVLEAQSWWSTEDDRQLQEVLHRCVREVLEGAPPAIVDDLFAVLSRTSRAPQVGLSWSREGSVRR